VYAPGLVANLGSRGWLIARSGSDTDKKVSPAVRRGGSSESLKHRKKGEGTISSGEKDS
jgi:hypothetical protein